MRAVVSRSAAPAQDDWGRPGVPTFAAIGTIPCFVSSKLRREVQTDGKTAVVEDLRAIVPVGADVAEGDRLAVTDRLGASLFEGPLAVDTIVRRGRGNGAQRECMLARHL